MLADTPAGYWRLGEASGTSASDETANSNHGIYQNAPALSRPGALALDDDTAVKFGATRQVEVPDSATLSPVSALTVETWVRFDSISDWHAVVEKNLAYMIRLEHPSSGGELTFFVHDGTSWEPRVSSGVVPVTGRWYHVVGTYDGSDLRVYVDGKLRATQARTGLIPDNANPLTIADGIQGNYVDGDLDEIAVYPTALSAARVLAHYTAGGSQVHFGDVPVATSTVTSADCTVAFGSSNDTAMLAVHQSDTSGQAMWRHGDGGFDPDFHSDGQATVSPGVRVDEGRAVVVQADGKVVIAGVSDNGTRNVFLVARLNTDGTPDLSFDGDSGTGNGVVTTTINTWPASAHAVAVQADGKIVVAGNAHDGARNLVALARYNTDGTLDTSFDGSSGTGNGIVTTAAGSSSVAYDVEVAQNGSIFAAGYATNASDDIALLRYNVDGTLETSFDGDTGSGNGIVTTNVDLADYGNAMHLQDDGRIVLAGSVAGGTDSVLVRYNGDGTLDMRFDGDSGIGNGIVRAGLGTGSDGLSAVAVLADGRIVGVGQTYKSVADSNEVLAARFLTDGRLDTTFDSDGWAQQPLWPATGCNDQGLGVVPQLDGRIVALGMSCGDGFALRFTSEGARDNSFSGDGAAVVSWGSNGSQYIRGADMGPDGTIVGAGHFNVGAGDNDVGAMRLGSVPVANYSAGVTDWATGSNMFGACLSSVTSATAAWTPAAGCPIADSGTWKPVPTSAGDIGAKIASTASGVTGATANLRFGLRTAANQKPGTYYAPLVFTVAAPNV